jgi:RecA/RadA recombinase
VLLEQPSSHVLLVDTERKVSVQAVQAVLQQRLAPSIGTEQAPTAAQDALRRLQLINIHDAEGLLKWCSGLEAVCLHCNVKLVVIDSIASAVRSCTGAFRRQEVLMQLAARLKTLAEAFGFAVVVTNQVHSSHAGDGGLTMGASAGDGLEADLGIAWSHAINTRIMLAQKRSSHGTVANAMRHATITKCPCAPRATLQFVVTPAGVMLPADARNLGHSTS